MTINLTQFINRLLQTIPVVIGVTLIVFSLMHLTPGDPVEIMMGQGSVTEGEIQRIREELGLHLPLPIQYFRFVTGIFKGDLGYSIYYRQPAGEVIFARLPATFELMVVAMIISLAIALPLGLISAVRQYSLVDKIGTIGALLGVSMPGFWLGLLLIMAFSVNWIFPVAGRIDFGMAPQRITGLYLLDSILTFNWPSFWSALRHILLPAITLGMSMTALTMKTIRSSMLEVIREDYITFARAKGLSRSQVVLKHAFKNALIPTITVITLNMGVLLGGNMIVETVFGWPGLGSLVVNAIFNRDYPLVQASVLIYAITFIICNLLADFLYTVLNPRVKF